MTNATTVAALTATNDSDIHTAVASAATLTDGSANTQWTLAPNGTKQFWIVFWLNETGTVQNDSGSYNVTIKFLSSDGKGITSTITNVAS